MDFFSIAAFAGDVDQVDYYRKLQITPSATVEEVHQACIRALEDICEGQPPSPPKAKSIPDEPLISDLSARTYSRRRTRSAMVSGRRNSPKKRFSSVEPRSANSQNAQAAQNRQEALRAKAPPGILVSQSVGSYSLGAESAAKLKAEQSMDMPSAPPRQENSTNNMIDMYRFPQSFTTQKEKSNNGLDAAVHAPDRADPIMVTVEGPSNSASVREDSSGQFVPGGSKTAHPSANTSGGDVGGQMEIDTDYGDVVERVGTLPRDEAPSARRVTMAPPPKLALDGVPMMESVPPPRSPTMSPSEVRRASLGMSDVHPTSGRSPSKLDQTVGPSQRPLANQSAISLAAQKPLSETAQKALGMLSASESPGSSRPLKSPLRKEWKSRKEFDQHVDEAIQMVASVCSEGSSVSTPAMSARRETVGPDESNKGRPPPMTGIMDRASSKGSMKSLRPTKSTLRKQRVQNGEAVTTYECMEAYDVLRDATRRRIYDGSGASGISLLQSVPYLIHFVPLLEFSPVFIPLMGIVRFAIFSLLIVGLTLVCRVTDGDDKWSWLRTLSPFFCVGMIVLVVCFTSLMIEARRSVFRGLWFYNERRRTILQSVAHKDPSLRRTVMSMRNDRGEGVLDLVRLFVIRFFFYSALVAAFLVLPISIATRLEDPGRIKTWGKALVPAYAAWFCWFIEFVLRWSLEQYMRIEDETPVELKRKFDSWEKKIRSVYPAGVTTQTLANMSDFLDRFCPLMSLVALTLKLDRRLDLSWWVIFVPLVVQCGIAMIYLGYALKYPHENRRDFSCGRLVFAVLEHDNDPPLQEEAHYNLYIARLKRNLVIWVIVLMQLLVLAAKLSPGRTDARVSLVFAPTFFVLGCGVVTSIGACFASLLHTKSSPYANDNVYGVAVEL